MTFNDSREPCVYVSIIFTMMETLLYFLKQFSDPLGKNYADHLNQITEEIKRQQVVIRSGIDVSSKYKVYIY